MEAVTSHGGRQALTIPGNLDPAIKTSGGARDSGHHTCTGELTAALGHKRTGISIEPGPSASHLNNFSQSRVLALMIAALR